MDSTVGVRLAEHIRTRWFEDQKSFPQSPGKTNHEITEALFIAEATVKAQLGRVRATSTA